MLTYKNKQLTINPLYSITAAETIIALETDIDAVYFGILTLADKSTKTLEFVKMSEGIYKTRLVLSQAELPVLNNVTMHLILLNAVFEASTNTVPVPVNIKAIKLHVKTTSQKDLQEMRTKLAKITETLDAYIKSKPIVSLNLANKDYIQPGMIPVALDSKGTFYAAFPFQDVILSVNGKKAINSLVDLTAGDIPIGTSDVETLILSLTEIISSQQKQIQTLNETVVNLIKQLNELNIIVSQETSGII